MKRLNKGFTLIEMLVVIGIIGIITGIGTIHIRKQENSKSLLRVRNELGDFFRVTAKHAKETGQRYKVNFLLEENQINIERDEKVIKKIDLPTSLEYEKISKTQREQNFENGITPTGNMSIGFTLYIFESNSKAKIQGDEKAIYAITFITTEKHIQYLRIKERRSIGEVKESEITPDINGSKDTSNSDFWEIIKKQ